MLDCGAAGASDRMLGVVLFLSQSFDFESGYRVGYTNMVKWSMVDAVVVSQTHKRDALDGKVLFSNHPSTMYGQIDPPLWPTSQHTSRLDSKRSLARRMSTTMPGKGCAAGLDWAGLGRTMDNAPDSRTGSEVSWSRALHRHANRMMNEPCTVLSDETRLVRSVLAGKMGLSIGWVMVWSMDETYRRVYRLEPPTPPGRPAPRHASLICVLILGA